MAPRTRATDNPLLSNSYLPNKALPFDTVTVAHLEEALLQGLKESEREIRAIIRNPDAPTFANTIEALEFSGQTLTRAGAVFGALLSARITPELLALQKKVQPLFAAHSAKISNDKTLFKRIKAVYDARDTLNLDAEQALLLDRKYKGMAEGGIQFPKAKQRQIADLGLKLSQASSAFSDNVTAATKAWGVTITDEKDLAGLPERLVDILKNDAARAGLPAGQWLVTMGTVSEVLDHAQNRALRENLFNQQNTIAYGGAYDNTGHIMEITRMRHQMAQIFGYETYAAMALKDRMAKTPQTVNDFLAKNRDVYQKVAKEDSQKVRALAAADGIADMMPWDAGYYTRKLKERDFSFSPEELRPYFELNRVVAGVFDHAGKLFNIGFADAGKKYPVYDADMKVYEVYDKKDGGLIGLLYTDYYQRPGAKRGGAWMSSFVNPGITPDGKPQLPHIINCCNYVKPAAGKPTLLSVDEVTTLFHEFGHALHGLLGRGRYPSLTGTRVARDFVELPSQLQENWVLEKPVLDSFALHHETGAKMPQDLVEKLRASSNFGAAAFGLRQTFLATLDMAWNNTDPATITSVEDHETNVRKLAGIFNPAASKQYMSTRFSHIFAGGYAAGYYGYKWAEVLDSDIFETKFKGNLYHRQNAEELRRKIYQPGGTRPPMDLFVDYMGREPDPDALFRREGLLPSKKAAKPAPRPPGA